MSAEVITAMGTVTSTFWPEIRRILKTEPARMDSYRGMCEICRGRMNIQARDGVDGECTNVVVCPCGHMFGSSCVKAWLERSGEPVATCPKCRTEVRPKSLMTYDDLTDPVVCCFRLVNLQMRGSSLGLCCPIHRLIDRVLTAFDGTVYETPWIRSVVRNYCVLTVSGVVADRAVYVKLGSLEEVTVDDPGQHEEFVELDPQIPFWQELWQHTLGYYTAEERSEIQLTSIRFHSGAYAPVKRALIRCEVLRYTRTNLDGEPPYSFELRDDFDGYHNVEGLYENLEYIETYMPQDAIYTGIQEQHDFEDAVREAIQDNIDLALLALPMITHEAVHDVLDDVLEPILPEYENRDNDESLDEYMDDLDEDDTSVNAWLETEADAALNHAVAE